MLQHFLLLCLLQAVHGFYVGPSGYTLSTNLTVQNVNLVKEIHALQASSSATSQNLEAYSTALSQQGQAITALQSSLSAIQTTLAQQAGLIVSLQNTITTLLKSVPGVIFAFTGNSAPAGYLLCNGQSVSRVEYAALFSAVGTTYGAGDGISTFTLPDLRGTTMIGAGTGPGLSSRTLGEKLGAEKHTLSISELPSHTHKVDDRGHSHDYSYGVTWQQGGSCTDNEQDGACHTWRSGTSYTGITIENTGSNTPHNIMQPSLVISYIIKF